jgi:hypothetical protein
MAIITSKFRVSAASGFASTFATDNIYLVLGRPQSWDNSLSTNFASQANGTVTDNNPPNPVDNFTNEYGVWRDAMAGVRLNYSDVKLATVRNNWQYNTKYDMYRHNVSSTAPTETGAIDLSESNMIVYVTSTGAVYKCLFNGRNGTNTTGVASTVMPSTTGMTPQQTADGYIWKYLYTITAGDADFITANYIPVPTTTSVGNINGIDVIYVTGAGGGYTGVPTVNIYGDGAGATATAVTSAGTVVRINVTAAGSGYTWAKVLISGGGAPVTSVATALAVIAPNGGHGSNLVNETMAHNVMIAGTVTGYLQNDFPVNQDFRTVALIKNPLAYSTSAGYFVTSNVGTLYTVNTGRILRTLTMTSGATTAPANDLVISGSLSLSTGLFVFQSSGTVQLQYIQPVNSDVPANISDLRIDTAVTKQLYKFTTGETITATSYSQLINSSTGITGQVPEIQPYSGSMLYLDYRQPVTRSSGQNEKINIVINF